MNDEELTPNDILKDEYSIVLTTFKKNGQGVNTPVWFALKDGKLLLSTWEKFLKVKRMKNNPGVEFAPAKTRIGSPSRYTVTGKTIRGVARFLEGEEAEEASRLLRKKYGFLKYTLLYRLISAISSVSICKAPGCNQFEIERRRPVSSSCKLPS